MISADIPRLKPGGSEQGFYAHHLPFVASYALFGLAHELSHAAAAWLLLPSSSGSSFELHDVVNFVSRALIGRYCLFAVDDGVEASPAARFAIRNVGWIFSLLLAIVLHCHCRRSARGSSDLAGVKGSSSWASIRPIVVAAAYVTALEAATTDLLGFVPSFGQAKSSSESSTLLFFCGNFGILLINSSWINIDGGKRALDMIEKMVEVTMMRGAQSGGVVTFEPAKSSSTRNQAPNIRAVRSRVVNAKRTVLSKGIRSKIEKDNCSRLSNNLRGWDDNAFNPNSTGKRLVRGFFGHTRFATSSKASMDGTHPHQWSPRRFYAFYPFQSAAASGDANERLKPKSQSLGVENFVTHNGDFEFYKINGKYYDTGAIQGVLAKMLRVPMPSTVDSAAIAGMMDLLRVQGCFALSVRYAVCFKMGGSNKDIDPMDQHIVYPSAPQHEEIGKVFESALNEMVEEEKIESLEEISSSDELRAELATKVKGSFVSLVASKTLPQGMRSAVNALENFVSMDIEDGDLGHFVQATVDAFFDNDLLQSTKIFLENAKGSYGLCVTTSMDAHRQVVFAAKGQTCSVAFYPRKGVICYGSEQAAVKAGLNYDTPEGKSSFGSGFEPVDENAVRLDLDDLGGEICLLDWGYGGDSEPAVSPPNRDLAVDQLMGGAVKIILLHQQNAMNKSAKLHKRLVQLENNEFIKPLLDDCDDPVLKDIQDIPRICANIQEDWQDVGLNRMTAWHLGQCIHQRMQAHVDGSIENHAGQVDILVTGCEVSLWAAEQFVADLQKCFPRLGIKAVSSNKLLGLFGQELSMPSIGFPFTEKSMEMKDPIVIIVSHSGGTFGPLACSNLMQSFSSSIFTVTSEWDTQVGKQLRSMYGDKNDLLTSRIFSTEVGVRPAEPCSITLVATHQLLTNIFEHICVTIISNPHFRSISGATITERDLQTLERCNRENIKSLERIVGVDRKGDDVHHLMTPTEEDLRDAGDLWSEHILENTKAYIMSFVYIVVTVTIGYPIITGITYAAGLRAESSPGDRIFYLTRFLDALIYFWLPQINVFIIRLLQGRNLRHRMVGRTVVIGDPCPWVAQSAEAFLSKIFACSYSIAGLNVLSGNPADHLVHRHTHRVVRGSLLVCGRPDGRLTALTTLEASTCLAVNQASSIQSIGGTCESITIGHNKSELPLSHRGIFLETHRPQFLCEKLLDEDDPDAAADDSLNKADATKVKAMKLTSTGTLREGRTSFVGSSMIHTDSDTLRKLAILVDDDGDRPLAQNHTPVLHSSIRRGSSLEDGPVLRASFHRGSSLEEGGPASSVVSADQDFLQSLMSIDETNEPLAHDSGHKDDEFLESMMSIEEGASSLAPNAGRSTNRKTGWSKLRSSITGGGSSAASQNARIVQQMDGLDDSFVGTGHDFDSSFVSTGNGIDSSFSGEGTDRVERPEPKNGVPRRRKARKQSRMRGSLTGSIKRGSSNVDSDSDASAPKHRSSASLLGAYSNMEKEAKEKANKRGVHGVHRLDSVINDMIQERRGNDRTIQIFNEMDVNGNGRIEFKEFTIAYKKINPNVSMVQLEAMFEEADLDGDGTLDIHEFLLMSKMPQVDILGKLGVVNRDDRGLVQVMPSTESYFGEELRKTAPPGVGAFLMSQSQHLAMELYESRIASMQRFVAMTVMFHQMGSRVQGFFPKMSCGLLGYRMDRTHSIMRIATTASPVSGADVRDRMMELHLRFKIQKAVNLVSRRYLQWKEVREKSSALAAVAAVERASSAPPAIDPAEVSIKRGTTSRVEMMYPKPKSLSEMRRLSM